MLACYTWKITVWISNFVILHFLKSSVPIDKFTLLFLSFVNFLNNIVYVTYLVGSFFIYLLYYFYRFFSSLTAYYFFDILSFPPLHCVVCLGSFSSGKLIFGKDHWNKSFFGNILLSLAVIAVFKHTIIY